MNRWTRAPKRFAAALAVLFLVSSTLLLFAPPASAHTPHDQVGDVAVSPGYLEDDTVYAISRVYVLRSTDRGETWQRLVNGLDGKSSLSSLATTIADADVVYLGSRGQGVYRSDDGGSSWRSAAGDLEVKAITVVEAAPHDADVVVALGSGPNGVANLTRDGGKTWSAVEGVVAPLSAAFAADDPAFLAIGDASGRLHVSSDGGSTFTAVDLDGGRNGGVQTVAASPAFSSDATVYIGTESGGVFKSTDGGVSVAGGNTLDLRDEGLSDPMVMDLVVASREDGGTRVWASTRNDGVFFSDDGADTWTSYLDGLTKDQMADRIGAPNFDDLELAPATLGADPTAFFATFDGLFRLVDSSGDWEYLATQVSTNIAGFDVSPNFADDQTIAVATYINGALLSRDAGDTFEPINSGLAFSFEWTRRPDYVARMTGISFYPSFAVDQKMFSGVRGYYFETEDSGEVWRPVQPEGLLVEDEFPADYLIPDFYADDAAFLGTDGGKLFRYDGDVDAIRLVNDLAGTEIFTLAVSPDFENDSTVMLGTALGVFTTRDGGETFELPDRKVTDKITAMVLSPEFSRDQTAWAGTPAGLWVTTDGGRNFDLVAETPFPTASVIEALAVSPDYVNDRTLLVSVKGRGLFRSTDGGATFAALAPQLLEEQVVFGSFYHPTSEPLLFSPQFAEDRTIFGIAEDHVYRSIDAGETWVKLDVPVSLHDPTEDAPLPLLASARYEQPIFADDATPGSNTFDTPIGVLSLKRILAAAILGAIVFGLLSLRLRGEERRIAVVPNLFLRAGISLIVLIGALLALAV